MSLFNPGIDTRHIIQQAMRAEKAYNTIHPDLMKQGAMESYEHYIERLEEMRRQTSLLTEADKTLIKLGSSVKYDKDGVKSVECYDSRWIQAKLKQMKSDLCESDLLQGVNQIEEGCNLKGTTIQDLSCLKKIGGTLTIDATSQLKDLSGLKEVSGSVIVLVKNKSDAKAFLELLGLNSAAIKGKIVPIIKSYL